MVLGRWFKKDAPLEARAPEQRLRAIAAGPDAQTPADDWQMQLKGVVERDEDAKVRAAALAALSAPQPLSELLQSDASRPAAAQRCATLLLDGFDHDAWYADPAVLDACVNLVTEQQLPRFLPHLSDAEHIALLAVRLKTEARTTLLAHPALTTEQGLQVLEKCSRNRDKTCNRHARDQLDTLRTLQRTYQDSERRLAEIDESTRRAFSEYQATPDDPMLVQKLEKLREMRSAIAETAQTAAQTLQAANIALTPLAAQPLSDAELEQLINAQRANTAAAEALNACHTTLLEVHDTLHSQPFTAELLAAATTAHAAWDNAAQDAEPNIAQREQQVARVAELQRVQQAAARLQQPPWQTGPDPVDPDLIGPDLAGPDVAGPEATLKQLAANQRAMHKWRKTWRERLNDVNWPGSVTAPPQISAVQTALEQVDAHLHELDERITRTRKTVREALDSALNEVAQAIEAGHSQQAIQTIKAARNHYRELSTLGPNADIEQRLQALSAQLGELQDWQQFATDPKRDTLLAEIETLAGEPLEPVAQAQRVKALRNEWRALGPPTSRAERAQQARFDELAQTAFAPSKAHFATQAQIRAENLAQRVQLCDQLQDYLQSTDFGSADMSAAEQIMRTAREEWRRFHPCDRKDLKPVEARFEALQAELHTQVKTGWEKHVTAREQLIGAAQALLDEEDIQLAIDGAKQLQLDWRATGSVPRALDQKLWRQFRQACDAIFARREQAHQARQAEHDARLGEIATAIETFEQAVARARSAADASRTEYKALDSGVAELLPGTRVPDALFARLREARSTYQHLIGEAQQQQRAADLQQWCDWDKQVSEREATAGGGNLDLEAPHPVFQDRIDGRADTADWQRLALQAEIAADLPSPESDQGARMALQIEFMNAGIRDLTLTDPFELAREWCASGPKSPAEDALRERLFTALAARL